MTVQKPVTESGRVSLEVRGGAIRAEVDGREVAILPIPADGRTVQVRLTYTSRDGFVLTFDPPFASGAEGGR